MNPEPSPRRFHAPVWDRGEPIDPDVLAFTTGDDWRQDQRLVEVDLRGSLAHVEGLRRAGLIEPADADAIRDGLLGLLADHRRGLWTVEEGDEDVHSAVERRLVERVGEPGKRLHTGRSRNDQVATDLRLWLRGAVEETVAAVRDVHEACAALHAGAGSLPLPGYTHLRRAMPSSVGDWLGAFDAALRADVEDLHHVGARLRRCPLGSGAGYGVPLALDRDGVAQELGFDGPEVPVTLTQWTRGRAELAYATALEGVAMDLDKLAWDLWLFTSEEFGFARLPAALTTGSSMMPQKRNPDAIELLRAHCRQVGADRAALRDVVRDLPSGYHRDFQLVKPPLFRLHDRTRAALAITDVLLRGVELDADRLRAAGDDPALHATGRALEEAARGVPFRDAYRAESRTPADA